MKSWKPWQVALVVGGVALMLVGAISTFRAGGRKIDVTGRVTYKGKPVIWGAVILVGPDGLASAGSIQLDGTFRVSGVKPGEIHVGVISRDPAVQQKLYIKRFAHLSRPIETSKPKVPPDRRKWFKLPEKFEEPETSGVSFVLKGGQQDIVLE